MLKISFFFVAIIIFCKSSYSNNIILHDLISLNTPWGLSFIDENQIILTEKKGSIKLYNILENKIYLIRHNLNISSKGQGGLLDIIYDDGYIYVTYSENINNKYSSTSIASAKYNRNNLIFKNIFRSQPPIKSGYHFGSRLIIKGNYIYSSIGERGKGNIAQDPSQHPGSIIRINKDGSIPINNPKFTINDNWASEVFQIGVRNPQGMTLSPFDSKIYISNHGARGGDWFGEVTPGTNYGWPLLGWGGTNYSGSKIGPKWQKGYKKAIYYWVPSIAVSSVQIYKGIEFKEWDGLALIASLKDQSLRILNFSNNNITENIIFSNKIGRIRDLKIHPVNGKIFLLSEKKLWLMEKK